MNRTVPIILWALVFLVGGMLAFDRVFKGVPTESGGVAFDVDGNVVVKDLDSPPDAVIIDVPWRHLPDINRFKLKDQNGDLFDSAKLAGRPYAVCFFFANCPTICRDLNKRVETLNEQLKSTDIQFISITVDPEHDSPEVLNRYAADFGAQPERWAFLTGQRYQIEQVGKQNFQVVIDKEHHIDNILLVDKWGRYRDRFKWDDPFDTKRFLRVAKELAAEEAVPLKKTIKTRNAMAGYRPTDWNIVPMLKEFWLTGSNNSQFYSRDMTGTVWITNFFFTSCPTVCRDQAKYLQGLQNRLGDRPTRIVSITTDPVNDRPDVLQDFAKAHSANPERWNFYTGETELIPRIGAEFFSGAAKPADGSVGGHHTTELFVVDRWGKVRGRFDWQVHADEIEMLALIEELWSEETPGDYMRKQIAADLAAKAARGPENEDTADEDVTDEDSTGGGVSENETSESDVE